MNAGEGPQPDLDLLSSSGDDPRAEDRLRDALGRTGALGWTRRHRPLVGGLAALLVVIGVGIAYLVHRPPPVDPVVDVSIAGFASGVSSDIDALSRSRAKLTYQVTVHGAGDVDTAVGIVGPGLSNPTSSISKVKFGLPRVGTLGATVDCSDSRWWAAKDADYRARVRRTDTFGRVTTYDAPLGPSGSRWHYGVRRSCLRPFVATMPPAVASASVAPGKHYVEVTLTVTNPSRHALWVQAGPLDTEIVTTTGAPVRSLPAGGSASVELSIRAADCASGTPHVPVATDVQGVPGQDIALPVYVTDERVTHYELAAAFPRVDAASTALLNRQLATLCPRHR